MMSFFHSLERKEVNAHPVYWGENLQLHQSENLHQKIGKTNTHAWDVKMEAQFFTIISYLNQWIYLNLTL